MERNLPGFSFIFMCLLPGFEAQNLVQNGSFELAEKMPHGNNRQIECVKGWRTPTFAGSDYYHMAADKHAGVPKNDFGKQEPHSGSAYGGICITKKYVEYLATTLSDTLVDGEDYLVELYVSRAEKSKSSVDEFGVLFTNHIRWSLDMKGIAEKPGVDVVNADFKDRRNWIRLSGVYHADGSETVIIVGYFNYRHPGKHKKFCHYYIDDVSVTPVQEETEIVKAEEPAINAEAPAQPAVPAFAPQPGETMVLSQISFASNASELLPASFPELDQLVEYLNDNPEVNIRIDGHTDNTGNESKNKFLSAERAKAVADYLVLKNIEEFRITYAGYGSARPIAGNDTEEGKQKNRRVEFTIVKR